MKKQWVGYLFISPWLIGFLAFTAIPFFASIYLSFTRYDIVSAPVWVGWVNYRRLFTQDPLFWKSLGITFKYAMVAVPLGIVAGVALALLLNLDVFGISVYRTVFYLPSIVPAVATSVIFTWILNPQIGLVNGLLRNITIAHWPAWLQSACWAVAALPVTLSLGAVCGMPLYFAFARRFLFREFIKSDRPRGSQYLFLALALIACMLLCGACGDLFLRIVGLGKLPVRVCEAVMAGVVGPAWLQDKNWALPSLIMMSLWGVGGSMVIYLAGLKDIPLHLYEAAMIDGANVWQRVRHVTLPMLTPVIFFNLIMGVISSFQYFTQAYIMTQGGPDNSTLFYALYLFNRAWRYLDMGYASAMAWILFLIIMVITGLLFKTHRRWVHYGG